MSAEELQVRVTAKRIEATDIASFELMEAHGGTLPAFSAGSHVDVHLPGGLTRPYSLCNAPDGGGAYQVAVLREAASRGGSIAMHTQVQVGDELRIGRPKNHFPLAHGATHSVLLAGGIGVTPLLCMAERLAHTGASFELHYSVRSVERAAFRQRIAASAFACRVHFHFDDGDEAQALQLAPLLAAVRPGVHLYVCGPQGYMDWVLGAARTAGWPAEQLHHEFFGADVAPAEGDAGFEVQLASSGRVIAVKKDQTVVQALAAAGVEVWMSCEQGVCGTCLTRVLEGECDHRDHYLTPEEQAANDQFTPCCSRAKSARLVLDL